MKDYTKYNFDAIVGAEVEIGNQHKIFGKVVCSTDEAVVIQLTQDVNALRKGDTMTLDKGTINALSAKIKVEDMSLKQMMEFCFHEGNCNYVVLYNDKTCVATCGKHAKNIELKDYIDCTDWGWKDE